MSSILLKFPFSSRYFIIAWALLSPIPDIFCNSSNDAVFILILSVEVVVSLEDLVVDFEEVLLLLLLLLLLRQASFSILGHTQLSFIVVDNKSFFLAYFIWSFV